MNRTTTKWLQRTPSPSAAARVFCIPHAGCGVSVFRNWPAEQGSVEFLAIDLPGRLTRFADPMPDTFQELSADLVDGLAPYLDVPFVVFGHCWAALAAYEMTFELRRLGLPQPDRIFASSQLAPQDEMIARMLDMTDAELAVELEKVVRDMGQQPHPELVAIYVDILQADLDMIRRYAPSDPADLPCPVTAVGWREDTEITPGQMAGWSACPDTEFVVLPGRHSEFIDAPADLIGMLTSWRTAGRAWKS
jgi:surfactin synthase thioesterase subunit